MLKDILSPFIKPIENNTMGWLMFIIIWACFLVIVGLIVYLILSAIDSWFRPKLEGSGEIVAMYFEPSHYSTVLMYNAAAKTSMPITTWHDDAWKLVIEVNGAQDDISICKDEYIKHRVGEHVLVEYTTGRIWKTVSIKSIFL